MRPRRPVPLALASVALLLTGCGGSSLLDGTSASELQTSLTTVRSAIDEGRCSEARSAARDGLQRVEDLPSSVDADLRGTLKDGFDALSTRVRTDCEAPATTTEEAPTTTEETTTEAPPVEEPTTTETQPETTTEETTTEETTTDDAPPTGVDGGTGVPDGSGGVVPGAGGPGAGERSVPGRGSVRNGLKRLRDRAEKAMRGGGPG